MKTKTKGRTNDNLNRRSKRFYRSMTDDDSNTIEPTCGKWRPCMNNNPSRLLSQDQVPPFFREPFIISGYRRCDCLARDCINSLFQATNETVNVWSHVLALVVFIIRFVSVFSVHNPWQDPFVYPLLCFAFGISIMLIMSSGAHLFNCMSIKIRHICFFFDYAAISVYTFTAGQVFYFYSRPLHAKWILFNTPSAFLIASALISFVSTLACSYSLGRCGRFEAAIKAGTYAVSWVFNTSPYWMLLWSCSTDCSSTLSVHHFIRHCLFYASGSLAYVLRIPERLMSGVFDVLGHSHHFLHILCAVGASDEFTAAEMDMIQRRPMMEDFRGPTFLNSIFLTALVVVGNIAVVLVCARQLNFKKSK